MVSHHLSNSRSSNAHSRPSTSTSNTPGHAKKPSSGRAPSREDRPSRDGTVQRAAQDVVGLKDYQLGDCLGKGAFGSVYRALNWGTGETVAIKQVRLENLGGVELKTIMLEIDLLKNLNHSNIVKYHGFVKSSESLYIILEYCENGSLHSICKNFGKFPENLVALYMSQVLHGLLYLHEQGVIHRDIKGANILTTKEGLVKLADFGVATKASGLDESSVVGTPYWMAPEVIELSGATTSSDIWSLGCTVIELIEGKPPYHKLQPMQALFRIVNDEHPPIPGSASPAVRDFLMQCFQKNPNLRISAKRLLKHPWIQSAKRTVSVVPTKPTEYDEAVKSVQEWNEALKSPSSLRRSSRLASGLGTSKKEGPQFAPSSTTAAAPRRTSVNVNIPKTRPNAESFRSPEVDVSDNWDDDFAESISPSALHLPHLRPQDNFAGLFSSEKLKAYASFEAVAEEPSNLDESSEATVNSPFNLKRAVSDSFEDAETVRAPSIRAKPPSSRSASESTNPDERHEGQPKTAFLRGIPKATQLSKTKVAALARPSSIFRENSVEDYSDLLPADESAFEKKLKAMQGQQPHSLLSGELAKASTPAESFSPQLFHPSDFKTAPKSTRDAKLNGNVRQRSASGTSVRKMQRSQSEIEIQKYAEDDKDNDFSDVFGDKGFSLPSRAESDSGSEQSSLAMITSKMSSSFVITDDDEVDPFANLEEGLENINLENNVARDRDDRLAKQTENLVGCLKTSQPDDVLLDIADQLIQVLYESPDKKTIVLRSHGMLPILEILATNPPREVVLRLLKIVNMIILEDSESQESLSFLGGIPIISNFAHKKYPSEIRKEAAAFVRQMYQTSTLTLQMFIGCGGINVLVEFLEEDIDTERDLVLIGVNGVWSVFELQGPTPKNDFCRIFSRSSVLYPLSLVLNRVVEEKDELAELIQGRIVNIFLIFSQAESHVKDLVADRMILKRVLKDLRKMSPNHQVTMLKFIKNLSMLSSTHEALQNSNAIDILIELLKSSRKQPLFREISNQILNTMYNLCRHNRSRQEEAALSDVIPILKEVVVTEWPLKEFALPILCELAHSGKVARMKLWENRGLQFYISLLADRNWQVTALDAIFIWLQEETARVEQHLLNNNFSTAIIDAYTSPELSQSTFENMLEPLQKLVRLSPPIAASLAVPEIFTRTVQKLGHKDAVTRLNLLRILRTICDATEDECTLIKKFKVYDTILHLSEHDPAILVRQMAEELVRACDEIRNRSVGRASAYRRPASSTGRAGSGSSNGSTILTGVAAMTPSTPTLMHSFSMPPTPSTRERTGRSQSTANIYELGDRDGTERVPPVLPRAATTLSTTASSTRTPSHRPPSRDHTSTSASLAAASNSSGGNSGSGSGKSRLPKARSGRASLANGGLAEVVSRRRRESSRGGVSGGLTGDENVTPTNTPLPRLQIVRRRRETSGGEMGMGRREGS
ncbi:hypothetical protein K469DRAFT_635407 [Zopfia rhizophila CBS 207.26]|uniref:non-specific serine/threonine protein kinase n=1 Tax=Zopfia rhizophila CBS 207.26 TaxID=1314779 RepID=A0A6A6DUP8_9PEZI|nr:hypothetical protein K469DRAFT_635407 [Zopfia rhizophila CBS 207.26]